MLTSKQLSTLKVGDRLVRTREAGERDTGTVEERGPREIYVRWRGSGMLGILDATKEYEEMDLVGREVQP